MLRPPPPASYFINVIYFIEAILFQIGAAYLIGHLTTPTVVTGVFIFLAAFMMEFLEFLQPNEIMRWIPFWNTTIGRGILSTFFSALVAMGHGFIGLLSFILALATLIWRLLSGHSVAPIPIFGPEEEAIPVEEQRRLAEGRRESYSQSSVSRKPPAEVVA
jgi:hypothetical protein